jgi:hypothetical protein
MPLFIARGVILGLVGVLALSVPAGAEPARDPFAACRERLAQKPDDYDSAYCFYEVTRDRRLWDEGARVFEALIARQPRNAWLTLAYGHVYRFREPDRAEYLYRKAAGQFMASGTAEGELLARTNLRDLLLPLGRVDEAAREVALVEKIGNASPEPLLKARAWSLQALHIQTSGGDLGHAFRLLKQAEAAVFPGGPYRLQRTVLNSLGMVAVSVGRVDEALTIFQRLSALATAAGELRTQAIAEYNIYNATAVKEERLPSPGGRERLVQLAERALAAGQAADDRNVMVRSHSALAELLATTPESRAAALMHLQECLTLASKAAQPYDEAVCSWIEAALLHGDDPRRARLAATRALAATTRANNPRTSAFSAGRHMRLSWSTKPRAEAIRDSLAAIDAVETLRALQDDVNSTAELFSAWTPDYYWLSGRLLEEGHDADLPLAFSITERMRARSLLDVLDRSRVRPDPRHPGVKEQRAALEAIAVLQRSLMNPDLGAPERSAALSTLEALERREREARRQVALAFRDTRHTTPRFAPLELLQAALGRDEAVLSFQVGLWRTHEGSFGGGSWLIAVTQHERTVHRLPDRVPLSNGVPVFTGLLERGAGGEPAAVRLYNDLLADAVAALPPEVTHLVIVADGPLHRLPFEALRPAVDAPPLGARYEIVVAPSATLWLHWRTEGPSPARRVLTLADPALEGSRETNAGTRSVMLQQGLRLGRLPHARTESRAIARHVGAVDALVGAGASEQALKSSDLRRYNILHFAAHAVADDTYPERSAVVLAAGDAKQDGLLQAREIEALDLDGRIVVLSACYTAGGAVLSGEGVLSLARAFFEAGAHAVIGSRWPLRDADAAQLFEAFYRHLGNGASLSQALSASQAEARAAGRPASAWAALVLLGNGDLRPFAGATAAPRHSLSPPALALVFAALLAVGAAVARGIYREGKRSP